MLLTLTPDQEVLRDATARYLDQHAAPAELRRRRDDPAGYDPGFWQRGAELGWTSLLVGEEHGGGSVSEQGLVDLTLLAYEFGRHAAPGPLLPTNVAAAALGEAPAGHHRAQLDGLLAGSSIVAWCHAEPRPNDGLGAVALDLRVDGSDLVLNGCKRPVEAGREAGQLLVSGRTGSGLSQVLVPSDAPGISIRPMRGVDLTRRFCEVTFRDVRVPADAVLGEIGSADRPVEHQLQVAVVIATAESIGAMQAAFDMTVRWAFDRYSFGRPLASYQELKHRFADMATWLEASHAVSDAAAQAVAAGTPEADQLVSAAKAFVDQYGSELIQDCVQIHGGIGITFEHDLHLFLRRHTVNRTLYGTPAEHRQRIADLFARGRAA